MTAGMNQGQRVELQGGGLRRSGGGWDVVQEIRRERESYTADERILGSSTFVEQVKRKVEQHGGQQSLRRYQTPNVEMLLDYVCRALGVKREGELALGAR